jgi:hypothetical protein
MPVNLDPATYPHIWDTIIHHTDVTTVLALRATSRGLNELADNALLSHLVNLETVFSVCKGDNAACYCSRRPNQLKPHIVRNESAVSHGRLLSWHGKWRDRGPVRVRAPLQNTPSAEMAETMRKRCKTLDVYTDTDEGRHATADLEMLAGLLQPNTLRIITNCVCLLDSVVSYLGAIHHRTAIIDSAEPNRWCEKGAELVVPAWTQRLVLHQCAESPFLRVRGSMPELVIVLVDLGSQYIGKFHDIATHIDDLVTHLSNTTITIVGLTDAHGPLHKAKFAARFKDVVNLKFRTRTEHELALSDEQWEMEMVLPPH